MAIQVAVKKWGNSMGVILPKKLVDEKQLKEDDIILIDVVQEADFSDDVGSLKDIKMSGQKFKDIVRGGWGP